jgi:hypothetical protein
MPFLYGGHVVKAHVVTLPYPKNAGNAHTNSFNRADGQKIAQSIKELWCTA